MRFTVPYPPVSNNHLFPTGKGGKRILAPKAKQYKELVAMIALTSGVRRLEGDVAMTIHFYRPRKIGDVSNFDKLICDALSGIAYHDDKQISESHYYRHDDAKNPRAEVEVCLAISR